MASLRIYPGNYDEYMTAVTEVRARLLAGNARKKPRLPNCKLSSAASPPMHQRLNKPHHAHGNWKKSSLMKLNHPAG
jgi:hypothetical protein